MKRPIDCGYISILAIVAAIAVWLLSMPVCDFVQRSTINRFHLQTDSFALWAIQQPIPSMYNFHNRYEVRPSLRPGPSPDDTDAQRGTLNHFPLRLFTFGDNREIFLRKPVARTIDLTTTYRDTILHTHWTATPRDDGGFDLTGEVVP